jgi:hypothetical protein
MSARLERLLSLFLVLAPFNLNADTVVLVRVHDQANIRPRTLLHCLSHLQRILVSAGASVDVAVFDAKVDGGAHRRLMQSRNMRKALFRFQLTFSSRSLSSSCPLRPRKRSTTSLEI